MRERHARDVVLVGFTTYAGTVTAASEWGGEAERKRVRPAPAGQLRGALPRHGDPRLPALPAGSRAAAARPARAAPGARDRRDLPAPRPNARATGSRPASPASSTRSCTSTSPAPSSRSSAAAWELGEPPETYPAPPRERPPRGDRPAGDAAAGRGDTNPGSARQDPPPPRRKGRPPFPGPKPLRKRAPALSLARRGEGSQLPRPLRDRRDAARRRAGRRRGGTRARRAARRRRRAQDRRAAEPGVRDRRRRRERGSTLSEPATRALGLTDAQVNALIAQAEAELADYVHRYRGRRPAIDLAGRTVILIDDGLATGRIPHTRRCSRCERAARRG